MARLYTYKNKTGYYLLEGFNGQNITIQVERPAYPVFDVLEYEPGIHQSRQGPRLPNALVSALWTHELLSTGGDQPTPQDTHFLDNEAPAELTQEDKESLAELIVDYSGKGADVLHQLADELGIEHSQSSNSRIRMPTRKENLSSQGMKYWSGTPGEFISRVIDSDIKLDVEDISKNKNAVEFLDTFWNLWGAETNIISIKDDGGILSLISKFPIQEAPKDTHLESVVIEFRTGWPEGESAGMNLVLNHKIPIIFQNNDSSAIWKTKVEIREGELQSIYSELPIERNVKVEARIVQLQASFLEFLDDKLPNKSSLSIDTICPEGQFPSEISFLEG